MSRREVLWVGAVVIAAFGCNEANNPFPDPVPGGDSAPVIHSMTVSPAEVESGGQATIVVVASDPANQGVAFSFSAANGAITADAAQLGRATYQHDGSPGPAKVDIRVTVTNQKGAKTTASRELLIKAPPAVEATPKPTPSTTPPPVNHAPVCGGGCVLYIGGSGASYNGKMTIGGTYDPDGDEFACSATSFDPMGRVGIYDLYCVLPTATPTTFNVRALCGTAGWPGEEWSTTVFVTVTDSHKSSSVCSCSFRCNF